MTQEEMNDAADWYANRHYDIGRDQMVSDRPPPACIAGAVAKGAEVDRRWREGMDKVYAGWSRGEQDPPWPNMMQIMSDVYGWAKR